MWPSVYGKEQPGEHNRERQREPSPRGGAGGGGRGERLSARQTGRKRSLPASTRCTSLGAKWKRRQEAKLARHTFILLGFRVFDGAARSWIRGLIEPGPRKLVLLFYLGRRAAAPARSGTGQVRGDGYLPAAAAVSPRMATRNSFSPFCHHFASCITTLTHATFSRHVPCPAILAPMRSGG